MSQALSTPGFGEADLSNCEREPIHLAGSIQPHGAMLVLSEPELLVVQASANAASFLGVREVALGRPAAELFPGIVECIRPHLGQPLEALPLVVRCQIGRDGAFDGLLHRPPGAGLVLELERAATWAGPLDDLQNAMATIVAASSVRPLCDETARIFRNLTGYDRVMVYRFDQEGNGEVLSEEKRADLEAFLGNRYPASDIPQIARRLYERNRVRLLVDVHYEPVPIVPRLSP